MPSTNGQANWFIFGSYVRLLQRRTVPGEGLFSSALTRIVGWALLMATTLTELYQLTNSIETLVASFLLMAAFSPIYLRLTLKKGRNGKNSNGGTKGGWTGFGRTGAQWVTIIVVGSILATALTLTGGLSWLASAILPKSGYTPTNAIATLPPGYAYCPGVTGSGPSGSFAYGSQPSNCLPIGMNLQIGLRNAANTNPCGPNGNCGGGSTAWTCQVIWGSGNTAVAGVAPGTPGTIAETVANVGTNGNCVTSQQLYYPSWALTIRVCHQATACASTSYGQQEFVGVLPFPGGTVPFYYGTQAPTSTWTQPAVVNVVPNAGDIAASNTPITFTMQAQNGTSFATAKTGCVNKGANLCPASDAFYFGAGVYINTFTATLTNTYTSATFPYIAGYTPFTDPVLSLPTLGTLTTNLQLEVKQTGGTNPICTVSLGGGTYGFSNGPYIKAASVPDAIYASQDLSSGLTVNRVSGYSSVSSGTIQIPFIANCSTLTAGANADTDSFTFNLYTYYSISWVSGNSGTLNTITAQTQMTQFVMTITS